MRAAFFFDGETYLSGMWWSGSGHFLNKKSNSVMLLPVVNTEYVRALQEDSALRALNVY